MKKIIKSFREVIKKYKLLNLEAQLAEAGFERAGSGELTYANTECGIVVSERELSRMMNKVDSSWYSPYTPVKNPNTPRRIFIELQRPVERTSPSSGEEYYSQEYTVFVSRQGSQ